MTPDATMVWTAAARVNECRPERRQDKPRCGLRGAAVCTGEGGERGGD